MEAANFTGIQAARRGTPWERTSENGDQHAASENSDWKLNVERVRKLELLLKTPSLARNKIKPNKRHDQVFDFLLLQLLFLFSEFSPPSPSHMFPHSSFKKETKKIENKHDEEHNAKQLKRKDQK